MSIKLTPVYSTYIHGNKEISASAQRSCGDRTYLEDDISRALFRERLIGFLNDIDVSRLGECDGFYCRWGLGHGWTQVGCARLGALKRKGFIFVSENRTYIS